MMCSECMYVERRGSILCCQIKQVPIYMVTECRSFKQFNEETYKEEIRRSIHEKYN